MRIDRRLLGLLGLAIGCGGGGGDVPPDATAVPDAMPPDGMPGDPFVGMYDDPSEFPHTNCTPGSLAGFAFAEYYPDVEMRTAFDGALHTYLADYTGEEERPYLLTDDDLVVRQTGWTGNVWLLIAVDVCGVDADGTLHGAFVQCIADFPCSPSAFVAPPLHRIAGEADGVGLTVLGEWNGGASPWPHTGTTNVRVEGSYAYLSRLADGVRIVSIATPSAPVEVGHFVVPGADFVNDLKLVHGDDGHRYAVTASTPCRVIDVTTPGAPELAAELGESAHSIFVEGQLAYLASGGNNRIEIYDLHLPRAPVKLGAWESPDEAGYHDLYVAGGIGYLSESFGTGLEIVDMTNPASPHRIGLEGTTGVRYWHSSWVTQIGGRPIAIHGDEGTGSGLRVLDVDPASPTFLATLAEWHLRDAVSIHNVMAFGARGYVAHYRDGVRVLDLSDPTAPAMIGYYNAWVEGTGTASGWDGTMGIDVDLARARIYAADSIRGLIILSGDATVFP